MRAARAAASLALLGAAEARRSLPGHTFAQTAVAFVAKANTVASRHVARPRTAAVGREQS
jgi:hypothetical protein